MRGLRARQIRRAAVARGAGKKPNVRAAKRAWNAIPWRDRKRASDVLDRTILEHQQSQ